MLPALKTLLATSGGSPSLNKYSIGHLNRMNYKLNYFLLALLPAFAIAQRIDNTASFRDIAKNSYFRFSYDNDFFTATDIYYTQGYVIELVTPWLKKNPVNAVLIKPSGLVIKYGLDFEQTGFIPTDITATQILYGDRPYASTIALKSFIIATDTLHKSRWVSSLTIGMIGPAALGDEIQTGIHKWIEDDLPQGWKYQIHNDLVLDYELAYEKQLLRYQKFLAVNFNSKARLGTLNTNVSTGINATLGLINAPFDISAKKPFTAYLYSQPLVTAVGYDATLQGGLFTKSIYTIPDNAVERLTLQNNFGIIVQYHSLYFEYSRSMITREFKTGHSHKWGGFKIGFKI
jgi:lipid A 3-O-deacylase